MLEAGDEPTLVLLRNHIKCARCHGLGLGRSAVWHSRWAGRSCSLIRRLASRSITPSGGACATFRRGPLAGRIQQRLRPPSRSRCLALEVLKPRALVQPAATRERSLIADRSLR